MGLRNNEDEAGGLWDRKTGRRQDRRSDVSVTGLLRFSNWTEDAGESWIA